MENFKIERKGYNCKEVDDYIENMQSNYETQLSEQKQILKELKSENSLLSTNLNEYIKKDGDISSALVVAVETAKEIENSAKNVYELEIQRVKLLYKKWQAVLKQITALYPKLHSDSSVFKLFKDFENNIVSILEKENQIEKMADEAGKIDNKTYAKSLLQRIKQSNYPTPSNATQRNIQIRRNDNKKRPMHAFIPPKINLPNQNERASRTQEISETNENRESEFEKFMNSEFDDFNAFQQGDIKNKHTTNLFESNLVSPAVNDSGFDLKEALTPKEDLQDIMKIFDLDDN